MVGGEVVDLVAVAGVLGGEPVASPVGEPAEERGGLKLARGGVEVVAAHNEHGIVADWRPSDAWRS